MLHQPEARTRIAVIVNAKSGSTNGEVTDHSLPELFAAHGANPLIVPVRDGGDIARAARRAVEDNYQIVVATGGDGTINAVANELVGTETALGVLPLGTLNHFAKDVRVPLDLQEAVANIFTGRVASVDVGEVDGRVFVNNSSLGLYPLIVLQRERQQRDGLSKWVAFALAAVTILRRFPSLHVNLHVDQKSTRATRTPFVFIGNNAYEIAGRRIGGRDTLNSGQLWVCHAPGMGRIAMLTMALRAVLGRVDHAQFEAFDAKEVHVRTKARRLSVATDGEVNTLQTPLHYRIRPGALRVVVPAQDAG